MSEPLLGHLYPSVHIPQLEDILAAFEEQKELLVALQDTINTLLTTIADEFQEVKAKLDAAVTAVSDALSRESVAEADRDAAQAALADLQGQVDSADASLQDAIGQVESISEADQPPA